MPLDPNLKRQFALLGLKPDASHSQIRTAYKRKAAALHPDRTNGTTTAQFQALREAYQAVMQHHKRQQALIKERARQKAAKDAELNRQRLANAYSDQPKTAQKAAPRRTAAKAAPNARQAASAKAAPGAAASTAKTATTKSPSTRNAAGAKRRAPLTKKPRNYWLWALILVGLALLALSLWQYQKPQAVKAKLKPPVPAASVPALELEPPAAHRVSYPEQRLGDHYSLGFAPLYELPPAEANPPLPELLAPPLQPVEVLEQLDSGWLKVSFAGQRFYTPEHLIGYGDVALAQRYNCSRYPLPRPQSGEVLAGKAGKRQLQVANGHEQDALISFLNQQQQQLQQVYLRGDDKILLHQVPANASGVLIEYGRFYNKGCGHFTADRREERLKIAILGGWQLLELP